MTVQELTNEKGLKYIKDWKIDTNGALYAIEGVSNFFYLIKDDYVYYFPYNNEANCDAGIFSGIDYFNRFINNGNEVIKRIN